MASILRGSTQISEAELSTHIAMALRLENVAVFTGSGASVTVGGQTISQLWSDLERDHAEEVAKLLEQKFVGDERPINIENVLGRLAVAIDDATRRDDDISELRNFELLLKRSVIKAARLDEALWENSNSLISQEKLNPASQMLAKLQASRQPGQSSPWIFTTNYDLSIEWAAEQLGIHIVNGFVGLHSRRFQPSAFDLNWRNANARGEAQFGSYNVNLVKMHGSLNWIHGPDSEPNEIPSSVVRAQIDEFAEGRSNELNSILIHPSSAKYFDTVGFIYGEMIRKLTDFLGKPNAVLFLVGYGFNDEHINRVISTGLLNPTLQLVIYYPEYDSLLGVENGNAFITRLKGMGLPRVIIKGEGAMAYFDEFVSDLPDPAMTDELSPEARRLLAELSRSVPSPAGAVTE